MDWLPSHAADLVLCARVWQDRSRDCLRATHDQWRSRGLRLEIYAMMCGSCVCAVAVKSAVVAITQSALRAL